MKRHKWNRGCTAITRIIGVVCAISAHSALANQAAQVFAVERSAPLRSSASLGYGYCKATRINVQLQVVRPNDGGTWMRHFPPVSVAVCPSKNFKSFNSELAILKAAEEARRVKDNCEVRRELSITLNTLRETGILAAKSESAPPPLC